MWNKSQHPGTGTWVKRGNLGKMGYSRSGRVTVFVDTGEIVSGDAL
jgi:hypothetical protein